MTLTDKISATLSDADGRAAVGQFMALLRRAPGLRQWLRVVTLDVMSRQKFNAFLEGRITPPPNLCAGRRLLGWLAGMPGHADYDIEKLKRQSIAPPIYGGLSRADIITLVRQYQAGTIDCGAFLVWHALHRDVAENGDAGFATANAVMLMLKTAIAEDAPQIIHQLARAADFFQGQKTGAVSNAHFGHSAWWKLNVLCHMLHHPKPAYRIGEFQKTLAGQNLDIDPSDIRRFCRLHNIARDMRPGRPRNQPAAQNTECGGS